MKRIGAGRSENWATCVGGLVATLALALFVPTGANADEPADANAEESAVVVAEESEIVDAGDAATAGLEETAVANARVPVTIVEGSNVRVVYPGIRYHRMGSGGTYRDKIPHSGVYSSRHGKSDRRGAIRYSGVSRGRLARYHSGEPSRIRTDGATRRSDPTRVAAIRHHWMGADRQVSRFGLPSW